MVAAEFSTVATCPINAAAIPASKSPFRPVGISSLTSMRYAWSGRGRLGNIFKAMMPGTMKKKGMMMCRKPAQTTPTRACHSSLAASTRCTMCWLVQLYQMPTVRKPPTHKPFPFTGVFTGFLTVGIWYSCTSQHIVQRVLSAKDEWNARVGVICAGFLHVIMPFFFIVPGIIAFKMFPHLENPDQAYLLLVKELIPTGLKGLLLAG